MSSVINLLHGDLPMAGLLAWPSSNNTNALIIILHYVSRVMGLAGFVLFFFTLLLVYMLWMSCFPFCGCHNNNCQLDYDIWEMPPKCVDHIVLED